MSEFFVENQLAVIYGETQRRDECYQLADTLAQYVHDGMLFIGFPVVSNADESVAIDALLVSRQAGVIAFLVEDEWPDRKDLLEQASDRQNAAFVALTTHLAKSKQMRKGRKAAVEISSITVLPNDQPAIESEDGATFVGLTRLHEVLSQLEPITADQVAIVQSALQRVPGSRRSDQSSEAVSIDSTMGSKLREIGRRITYMDKWQKAAAIESPSGPQRIRGLAGTGKTVVLAHKAAYLHTRNPDWRIAVTYHTRALRQQIANLVDSFVFDNWGEPRIEENLQIVHSWGSARESGLYAQMAAAVGMAPRSFGSAAQEFGYDRAFKGACAELLKEVESRQGVAPIFDVVLVDEAQDLPVEFFRLLYAFTSEPHRIVWAYDEFQKLSDEGMPGTKELFGITSEGASLVSIENPRIGARRDIVLPTSYRNTPWALTTAHSLGLGIYSGESLINYPEHHSTWNDIGYTVHSGELLEGSEVTLRRNEATVPEYFNALITPDDAVQVHSFATTLEQDNWVAQEIAKYMATEEIRADDCLIVLPEPRVWKSRAINIRRVLHLLDIRSHLVGIDNDIDEIHVPGSVAIAHIYRAKGNEAPIVFALDSEEAIGSMHLKSRRNAIFTAITRSKGWVRICGTGTRMTALSAEVEKVESASYRLTFIVPTAEQIKAIRAIPIDNTIVTRETLRAKSQLEQALRNALAANLDPAAVDVDDELKEMIRKLQVD